MRKRFKIKNLIRNNRYTFLSKGKEALCPPLEGGPKSLISRRGTQAKRALNVVRIDKQNTGLIHVTNLFPYSPVLDLLHAHGDSPEERCSSRLVPFAIRTRFAVLLAGVKRVCNAAAFASPFRPLPARAPSVRKSAIPLFPYSPKNRQRENPALPDSINELIPLFPYFLIPF